METAVLSHPLTIALLGALFTIIGWIAKTIFTHGKLISTLTETTKDIRKLTDHVIQRQDRMEDIMMEFAGKFGTLKGEHDALKFHQKKTG